MSWKTRPLRYKISNWHQLNSCLSNTSQCLHANVSHIIDNCLHGIKIYVEHDTLGILFCCVVHSSGPLLEESVTGRVFELTPGQILEELRKFGFLIEYDPTSNLPGDQLQFLSTLNYLGYDKLRILAVKRLIGEEFDVYPVVFQSSKLSNWLNNGYSPSNKEFTDAIKQGHCYNLTSVSETKHYDWNWLYGWVGSIEDVLNNQEVFRR